MSRISQRGKGLSSASRFAGFSTPSSRSHGCKRPVQSDSSLCQQVRCKSVTVRLATTSTTVIQVVVVFFKLELPEAEVDGKKKSIFNSLLLKSLASIKHAPVRHHSRKHIRTFRNSHTSHPHAYKSHPSTHWAIVKPQNRKQQAAPKRKTPRGLAIHRSINLSAVRADTHAHSHTKYVSRQNELNQKKSE